MSSSTPVAAGGVHPTASGSRTAARGPRWTFVGTALAGYLVLLALTVAVGLLLVHVLLPVDAVSNADEELPTWLASERTPPLDDASQVGSLIGDIPTLPLLVTLAAIGLAATRRFLLAVFVVTAGLTELATYRVTSLLVSRDRPEVVRMDDYLPPDQSYPSGHVAASVAVYVALALVVTALVRRRWLVIACWTAAVLLPLLVGASRMYRGMHHPLDELAGAAMGVGAVCVAVLAVRAYERAART